MNYRRLLCLAAKHIDAWQCIQKFEKFWCLVDDKPMAIFAEVAACT